MPVATPALNINRLCGSGFQSVVNVAQEIQLGEASIGVAAGTESMSQAPMSVYGQHVRFGAKLGSDLKMVDSLWAGLTDSHAGTPMGITAENLASDFGITRAESDEYAVGSQTKWAEANSAGKFASEIAPIELKGRKGVESFEVDEHPRLTPLDKMGKLACASSCTNPHQRARARARRAQEARGRWVDRHGRVRGGAVRCGAGAVRGVGWACVGGLALCPTLRS